MCSSVPQAATIAVQENVLMTNPVFLVLKIPVVLKESTCILMS